MEENKSHKQFDELIRSKFSGAESAPDDFVWDAIEARLDEKRKRPGFIFWLSGILLLVIAGGAAFLYVKQNEAVDKAISSIDFSAGKNKAVTSVIHAAASKPNTLINSNTTASLTNVPEGQSTTINAQHIHPDTKAAVISDNKALSTATNQSQAANNAAQGTNSALVQLATPQNSNLTLKQKTVNSTTKSAENVLSVGSIAGSSALTGQEMGSGTVANHPTVSTYNQKVKQSEIAANQMENNDRLKQEEEKKLAETKAAQAMAEEQLKAEKAAQELAKQKFEAEQKANEQKAIEAQSKATADSLEQAKALAVLVSSQTSATDSITNGKDSSKVNLAPTAVNTVTPDSSKKAADFLRMILSIYYSPEYYENKIQDNSGQFANEEKQSNRYSAGFKFSYALLDKLAVRIGLSYSEIKQQLDVHKIYFDRYQTEPFVFHSSMGDMPVDMAIMKDGFSPLAPPFITQFWCSYYYYQKAQFIHLPLELKYGFTFGRVGISALLGINTQYVFKQHAELDLIKEHVTNTVTYNHLNLNTFSFAATGGLSVDVKLTKRFSLFLEPNARLNITPVSKSTTVKSQAYFLGVNGGVGFHF